MTSRAQTLTASPACLALICRWNSVCSWALTGTGLVARRRKLTLVLDTERYRYQQFISDIAGQDIKAHGDAPGQIIAAVRNFLAAASATVLPGGRTILRRFTEFRADLPAMCHRFALEPDEPTFPEYCQIVTEWLSARVTP